MTLLFRILLSVLALIAMPAALRADGGRSVFRVSDGRTVGFDAMISEAGRSRVITIGEVHNVPVHHRIQLDVIRKLHAAGIPLMIGLEMFRAEEQQGLDRWVAGTLDEVSFRKLYDRNWTVPWPLYRDIFLFAREKKIPLIGLNVEEGITEKVARSGFSSLTPEERAKLPAGISCTVDETYEDFIRRAHGTRQTGKMFRHFCEAQMVWDSAMAHTLAAALERHPGRTAVVLAGSGHAWRRGIPTQLSQIMPDLRTTVVLPAIEDQMTAETVTKADADFLVL